MKRKLKDFYGAHPIRRTLLTIVIAVLAIGLIYFYPAFSLKGVPIPETSIPTPPRARKSLWTAR